MSESESLRCRLAGLGVGWGMVSASSGWGELAAVCHVFRSASRSSSRMAVCRVLSDGLAAAVA